MDRSITFQDIQRLLPNGRYAANECETAFDVEDGNDCFLYREEWGDLLKQAELCLSDDSRYRLRFITGEMKLIV